MPLHHERRRRVLADELLSASDEPSEARLRLTGDRDDRSEAGVNAYASAVRRDRERRVLDLIPTRPLAIAWFALVALLLAALSSYCTGRPDRWQPCSIRGTCDRSI